MLKLGSDLEKLLFYDITSYNTPIKCNYKAGGKDVFVIRTDVGSLPNAKTKDVNIGLSSNKINTVLALKGMAYSNNVGYLPLPYSYGTVTGGIGFYLNTTSEIAFLRISTGADRSAFTAYVDLYFTYA